MVDVKTQADGVVVFWSLAEFFNRDRLKRAWLPLGLAGDVPEPRSAVSCLKDALLEVYGTRDHMIRPLAAKNGFTVQVENRGADDNTYSTLMTAKVYGDKPIFTGSVEKIDQVNAAFYKHIGRLPSAQVTTAMVKVLTGMGATRLRPTGGIYWLRGDNLAAWQSAMAGVEQAAEGGTAVGYAIKHDLDTDSVKAVQDAITNEVASEAARLYAEIHSGDIGEVAIKNRKAEAVVLRKKVAEYEKLLGVGLEHLRKTLDTVDQTNAVASLLLAANPFESEPQEATSVLA